MPKYQSVTRPPLTAISFLIFMYFSFAFAIWAAFDLKTAAITMVALCASVPFIIRALSMKITVDDELRIDRAHIELKYLRDAVAVDEAQYKLLRTTKSDARAFHATRPWLKKGVQVFVNDNRDQTTYWLIGCEDNERLSAFLTNS